MPGYSWSKSLQNLMEPERERAEVCRRQLGGMMGKEVGWWAEAQMDSREKKTEKSLGSISLPPSDGSSCWVSLSQRPGVMMAWGSRLGDCQLKEGTRLLVVGSGVNGTRWRYRSDKQGSRTVIVLPL